MKKAKKESDSYSTSQNLDSFARKYFPKSLDECVVSSKKIDEVKNWIHSFFSSASHPSTHRILVLVGPSGCGKSSMLHLLSKSTEPFEIVEYIEPVQVGKYWFQSSKKGDSKESRVQHFKSFLSEGKQYLDLTADLKHKILLIESFPFLPSSNEYSDWKLNWKQGIISGLKDLIVNAVISPLVIIFHTDSFLTFQRFIGADLVSKMTIIQFNGVTKTKTFKILKKITAQEMKEKARKGQSIRSASELESYLEKLSENCEGDLRKALFTLEFYLLGSNTTTTTTTPKVQDVGFIIDPSLSFFHALGKVLYNKPSSSSSKEESFEISDTKKKRKLVGKHGDSETIEDILRALKGFETDQEFSIFRTFLHSHYTSFFPSSLSDLEKQEVAEHTTTTTTTTTTTPLSLKKFKGVSSSTTNPSIGSSQLKGSTTLQKHSLILTQATENTWKSAEWLSFAEMMTDGNSLKKDVNANESLATLLACRGIQESGIGRFGGEGIGKPFHRPAHFSWKNRNIGTPPPLLTFKSKIACQEQLWYTEIGPFWAKISSNQPQTSLISSFISKNGLTSVLSEIGKFSAPNTTLDLKLAPLSTFQKQGKNSGFDPSDARAQSEKKKINMSQAVLLMDDIQEF